MKIYFFPLIQNELKKLQCDAVIIGELCLCSISHLRFYARSSYIHFAVWFHLNLCQPILAKCFISVPPENSRKPNIF